MTYTLSYEPRFDYFFAYPEDESMDALTLAGETEQQAREFASRTGVILSN